MVDKHLATIMHEKPLGPRAWKLWVEDVFVDDAVLYRGDGTLGSAYRAGEPIIWPYEFIQPDRQ